MSQETSTMTYLAFIACLMFLIAVALWQVTRYSLHRAEELNRVLRTQLTIAETEKTCFRNERDRLRDIVLSREQDRKQPYTAENSVLRCALANIRRMSTSREPKGGWMNTTALDMLNRLCAIHEQTEVLQPASKPRTCDGCRYLCMGNDAGQSECNAFGFRLGYESLRTTYAKCDGGPFPVRPE